MHLQAALRQASLKLRLERLCLLLVTAVHQSIVCIPTPREIRVFPRHPESHLSMYNSAHLHVTCFRTARSKSSWLMLSNRPLMSNSNTQSYFQHRSRVRSEEHTSELQSRENLVCRLL